VVAHDDRYAVFFRDDQCFFDAGAVAEVFDVDGIDFTAFNSVADEVEIVAFRNFRFAAFFFSTEREQDSAVWQFLADSGQSFADSVEGRDVFQEVDAQFDDVVDFILEIAAFLDEFVRRMTDKGDTDFRHAIVEGNIADFDHTLNSSSCE